MRALGARPRALADDWLVSVSGQGEQEVVATFKEAFGATFQFTKAMGGLPAPQKSRVFANWSGGRRQLKRHWWQKQQGPSYPCSCAQETWGLTLIPPS